MRMAESASSYLSSSATAVFALRLPSSAAELRRIRLAEVSAISEAEKKAEPASRARMAAI